MSLPKLHLSQLFPNLDRQILILAMGRLLSQTGTGFTLFYAPIFFVNQVGLSTTSVGIALSSAQISGIIARFLGGSFSDSQFFGRRITLLLSLIISALASIVMAIANNFYIVAIGNLLLGLGTGLYWPAMEAIVADLAVATERKEAYAVTRLADNLGLQLGIISGGIVVNSTGAYRALFIVDSISFLIFAGVIYLAVKETYKPVKLKLKIETERKKNTNGWLLALSDRNLIIFVMVNVFFTFYISQIHSTIPLYLNNFVSGNFSPLIISYIFTVHTALTVIFQLPVARKLRNFSHPQALIISAILWGLGFLVIGIAGIIEIGNILLTTLALSLFAIAIISYTPSASALVADLAPESLRGIYLAINAQCWAIGYLIGPLLGGLVLDRAEIVVKIFWLSMVISVGIAVGILQYLDCKLISENLANTESN
ncbi:MAG: MFS transporter [Okeania sp. SIO2C2]|uniref:MFS transporter n=1 Tax=Okeania sp. SIO2C2 TaxID=2607787 RepID=UPI0013B71A1F|nr:MFS transporter [Okeania sp. SIO2C2]NEP89971.1 MFS transporter [Okeania sp. SIO2C2]